MSVIIAHPGTQHVFQAVRGLQEADELEKFFTGFYFKNSGLLRIFVDILPKKYGVLLSRQLCRRRREILDDNLVCSLPFGELVFVGCSRFPLLKPVTPAIKYARNLWFDRAVARTICTDKPAVFIGYDGAALSSLIACRRNNVVGILDQAIGHVCSGSRLLREEADLHPDFGGAANMAPNWLIERCRQEALTADYVLAASDYVRKSLIDIGVSRQKIIHLPYGVDVDRFKPSVIKVDDGVFRVLFVGAISQRKGIMYLLEAFKRLNLPNAELILVGEITGSGQGLSSYKGTFHHMRQVPHEEIHTLFQAADCFVYPSLHEGSALAILEAMASGLPVITTPNSGSVINPGHDGYIVPIRNIEAIMNYISFLYWHPDVRRKIGLRARQTAESHTWEHYRVRLAEIIKAIQDGRPIKSSWCSVSDE